MNTYFIGDIHGCVTQLDEILEQINYDHSRLIFLGDYVNRGPDSAAVLNRLIELKTTLGPRAVFLEGNHDREMLAVLQGGPIETLLMMGGAPTVRSYNVARIPDIASAFRDAVPGDHWGFLRHLLPEVSIDSGRTIASHQRRPTSNATFEVFGHLPNKKGGVEITESFVSLDSGCGTTAGGYLSALEWPTRKLFKSRLWNRSQPGSSLSRWT